jgi:hypothetical protein
MEVLGLWINSSLRGAEMSEEKFCLTVMGDKFSEEQEICSGDVCMVCRDGEWEEERFD